MSRVAHLSGTQLRVECCVKSCKRDYKGYVAAATGNQNWNIFPQHLFAVS